MADGFIVLQRKITDWEWYQDIPVKVLFLHLLLKANYKDKNWQGNLIRRGQFVTGRSKLSEQTGLSEQEIRTALTKLKSTNEITIAATRKNSVITITNYDIYQSKESQSTNNQPTINQQSTTTNKETKKEEVLCEFDIFWAAYPRKTDKKKARDKFKAKVKGNFEQVMAGLQNYKAEIARKKLDVEFIKHAKTWLEGECWENQPEIIQKQIKVGL